MTIRIGDAFCSMGVLGYAAHLVLEDALTVWAANSNAQAVEAHARFYENAGLPVLQRECADLLHYGVGAMPRVDLLLAGPSCPAFSQAGQPGRASSQYCRDRHDVLRMTPTAIHDLVDGCRPKRVLVENVVDMARWEAYGWWMEGFKARGYEVATIVLNDHRVGGYQDRDRLFVAAWKKGLREVRSGVPFRGGYSWDEAVGWEDGRWKYYEQAPAGPKRRLERALDKYPGHTRYFIQNVTGHAGRVPGRPSPTLTTADQFGLWKMVDAEWFYRCWSAQEQARLVLGDQVGLLPTMRKGDLVRHLGNAVPLALGKAAVRWACPPGSFKKGD